MAIVEVKVPQLSESVAEATLLTWKKKAGESVAIDEILIEIETDKVVLEVPAPAAGVLVELVQADGATVAAEQLIARIDTEAVAGAAAPPDHPLDGVSLRCLLQDSRAGFARPLFWRMNHRGQRALRSGDWKYLRVDGHDYLFNLADDERERANHARHQPERLQQMRTAWEDWNATMPPIPADATVSLGYSVQDMPQR